MSSQLDALYLNHRLHCISGFFDAKPLNEAVHTPVRRQSDQQSPSSAMGLLEFLLDAQKACESAALAREPARLQDSGFVRRVNR